MNRIASRRHATIGLAILMATSACSRSGGHASGAVPVASSTAASPQPSSSSVSSPSAAPLDRAAIDALGEASRKLARADRSDLDLDRKATELGPDVDHLFAFVRDDVHLQVYVGVLRGARGTLMGRAGNAWDKSVLLAALLRHHGREVRFARGRLTPDRAAAVVARMFADARQPPVRPPLDLPSALVARSRSEIATIETRWRAAQANIEDALKRSSLALGRNAAVTEAALAAEAADHVWIEYRDGDRWTALDPAAATRAGEAATAATETFAQIPDGLYHQVTFRVKLEQRKGQTLEERDAFVWHSTAAALHGASLLFTHRFDRTPFGQWRAQPLLVVDGRAYGARSFTGAGLQAGKASDALVGEAGRQMQGVGRVNELLGGSATPVGAATEWTAERLEIEFTDPAGHTEAVRRELVDRVDPVARARGEATTAPLAPIRLAAGIPSLLAGLYGCAVTAGPIDPRLLGERLGSAFAARSDSAALQNIKERDPAKLSADDRARASRVVAALPSILEGTAQLVHVLSQTLARRFLAADGAAAFYEATPRLALVSLEPSGMVALDLRRNSLRVVAPHASGQDLVRANLARGVLDGVIEDTLVPARADPVRTLSAVAAMELARAQSIPIAASTSSDAARTNASEVARARMQAWAGQPIVIVAPTRSVSIGQSMRMAWWSIDPATGETLGVLDSGLHGAQPGVEAGSLDALAAEMVMELGPGWVEPGPAVDVLADTVPNGLGGLGGTVEESVDLFAVCWLSGF